MSLRPVTLAQLKKVVEYYQKLLGLSSWELKVEIASEALDAFAETMCSNAYETATITFSLAWKEWDVRTLTATILHELLHIAMRDLDAVVEAAQSQLHPQASQQIAKRYDHEAEGFVDRLALRIYDLLPRE